ANRRRSVGASKRRITRLASTRLEATAGRSREPVDASSEKEDAAQTPLTRFHRNCGTEVHCNSERDQMTKLNYPQWNYAPTPAASARAGKRGCPTAPPRRQPHTKSARASPAARKRPGSAFRLSAVSGTLPSAGISPGSKVTRPPPIGLPGPTA